MTKEAEVVAEELSSALMTETLHSYRCSGRAAKPASSARSSDCARERTRPLSKLGAQGAGGAAAHTRTRKAACASPRCAAPAAASDHASSGARSRPAALRCTRWSAVRPYGNSVAAAADAAAAAATSARASAAPPERVAGIFGARASGTWKGVSRREEKRPERTTVRIGVQARDRPVRSHSSRFRYDRLRDHSGLRAHCACAGSTSEEELPSLPGERFGTRSS